MPFWQRVSWIFSSCFYYTNRKQKVHRRNLTNRKGDRREKISIGIPATEKRIYLLCLVFYTIFPDDNK